MNKKFFILPLLASIFIGEASLKARGGFCSGFGWGTFTGFATGLITSKIAQNEPRPVVVYREPQLYPVPQPVVQPVIRKQIKYVESPENRDSELELLKQRKALLKEENRKKELKIREKELELKILSRKK